MMELGGNITLVGFKERDFAEIIVVKKLVGQYARRFHDNISGFEHLTVSLKTVGTNKLELHAKCEVSGTAHNAEVTDRNLFVALDSVLKKVLAQIEK